MKRGPGDSKGMSQGVRAAGLQRWALEKLPLQGRPGETVPRGAWLARERSEACPPTRTLTPVPEAALGLEQGLQEVT